MNNTKKTLIGVTLLIFMMVINFQNAFNEYGIKSNVFMNGIVASGSGSGGSTERSCTENENSTTYHCTKAPKPDDCMLYRILKPTPEEKWNVYDIKNKPRGTEGEDYETKSAKVESCPKKGNGCTSYSCRVPD